MSGGVWARVRRHAPAAFGLALLVGAVWVVQREFRGLSLADIRAGLEAMPAHRLWAAAGLTVLAYAVLTIYDRLGSIYAGRPVSYARTSLAAFCAYTLAHNLGFAAVSGAAVRYRFYAQWGLSPVEIAKVVAFTSLTFGLGGFALGGLVLIAEPGMVPWLGARLPPWALQAIGAGLWVVVAAYVLMSRLVARVTLFGHVFDLPGPRMAVAQTVLATVDVALTAAIFYAVLPEAEGLTFLKVMGVYVIAYTAGLAASVPGGLGVFDGAVLLGLQPYLPTAEVVGALLVFRLFYYVIPLFLAGILFAGFELASRRQALARLVAGARGGESLEVPVLTGLVAMMGALLIFLGALPVRPAAAELWAGHAGALASRFVASLLGTLLLVNAYGLLRRLRVAWAGALILLALGALIVALKGEDWWLAGVFVLVAGLVAALRSAFYRDARLLAEPLSPGGLTALVTVVGCSLTLALVAYGGRVSETNWWGAVFSPLAPDSLRFTVGLSAVLLLVALVRLARPARLAPTPYDALVRERLRALGALAPRRADGAVFGEGGRAGFAFLRHEKLWLGLGDPEGEDRDRISAVWRFRDLCDRAGVQPAFCDVGPELLRVYGDVGLAAFPLDGDGRGGETRYLACHAERDLDQVLALLPSGDRTVAGPARGARAR